MSAEIKYIPLTFITSQDEILNQLRNSVMFSYLRRQCQETNLGEYLESTQYGFTASASDSGRHRLLRITDITNGKVNWNDVPFCDCDSEEKYLIKDNDILIARTGGTTGKSFIVKNAPPNAVFASYLIRLRLKKGIELSFIEAFLNSYAFWPQVIELKGGTAMPNVNAEKLKTLRLPLCDSQVQKQMIDIIRNPNESKYPELTSNLRLVGELYQKSQELSAELTHQLSLVKQLRQAFLLEAMRGKLMKQNPNDEPAGELLKRIKAEKEQLMKEGRVRKEKDLPPIKSEEIPFEIPKPWVWCRLGDLIDLISGQHIEASDYNITGNGVPYLTGPSDFGILFPEPTRWTTKPKVIALHGDILITVKGSGVGKTNVSNLDQVAISRQLMAIRPIGVVSTFVKTFIDASFESLQLEKKGTGIPGIARENITERPFPLPPISEQQRIVDKLEHLFKYTDELADEIKLSQVQNDQLLQQVLREAMWSKLEVLQ